MPAKNKTELKLQSGYKINNNNNKENSGEQNILVRVYVLVNRDIKTHK